MTHRPAPAMALERPPSHRCPLCRYWHDGPEGVCATCERGLVTDGIVLRAPPLLPQPPRIAQVPSAVPDASPVSPEGDRPSLPLPRPPCHGRQCTVCRHPHQRAIDAALREGVLPASALHARYGPSIKALSRHRVQHLRLPPMTPRECGQKRQRLAHGAPKRSLASRRRSNSATFHQFARREAEALEAQLALLDLPATLRRWYGRQLEGLRMYLGEVRHINAARQRERIYNA